jgi:Zn-dependent metalloprotease
MIRITVRLLPFLLLVVGSLVITGRHTEANYPAISAQEARRSLEDFRSNYGHAWKAEWGNKGRLKTLTGSRYRALPGDPPRVARQFLRENNRLFQMRGDLGDLSVVRVTESLSGHHVQLQQTHSGLPVIGGVIDVHLDRESRVFLVHNNYVPAVEVPTVSAAGEADRLDVAVRNFKLKLGARAASLGIGVLSHTLGIYDTQTGPELAHLIVLRSSPLVDAREYVVSDATGAVLRDRPLVQESVTGKGQVFDPNPVNKLNDTSLTDQADADAAVPAGAYSMVSLLQLNDAVDDTFGLTGPYVSMEDIESPSNTPPRIADKDMFIFTRNSDHFEEVMCYFHIDRNQRYIQSLGFTNINNRPHKVDAHGVDGDNNSHYLGVPTGMGHIAFGDGGVDGAEDADTIMHEYGHSIQDNSSNGKYLHGGEAGAMGEGFGDYWAASNSPAGFDIACVAEWDYAPCLRRVDGNKHYPEDIEGEVHADGEIWSAALWAIRQSLGREKTDKIVLESHFLVPDNPTFKDGAEALLKADEMLFEGKNADVICEKMTERGILDGCLDIVFTIDTTGSMFDDIDAVKASATDIVNALDMKNVDYRMAVVNFEDFPVAPFGSASCGDATFHDVLGFSKKKDDIVSAIQSLTLRCGADLPESVYSALMHGIDATSLGKWRKVNKAIILMGDAPGHDPEPFTGFTLASVIAAADAGGVVIQGGELTLSAEGSSPVRIYPVLIGFNSSAAEQFAALAEGTGGELFQAPTANEVVDRILEALDAIVQPKPCVLTCPPDVEQANDTGKCEAVVNYPDPTTTGECGAVSCSPPSGSLFPVGTTTVTCSGTGADCSFEVTVVDNQAPALQCPPDKIAVTASPGQTGAAVSYGTPAATDNCAGVTTVCAPASGSIFAVGLTTVTCTATDAAGLKATCTFTVTVYDVCLQDSTSPNRVLLFNSFTGDYVFCCGTSRFSGRGTITKAAGDITLQHNASDRKVLGKVSTSSRTGSASLQSPPGSVKCTVTDPNIRDNGCACGG